MKSFPHYHHAAERKAVKILLQEGGTEYYVMWYEGVLNWLYERQGEPIDLNDDQIRHDFEQACLPLVFGNDARHKKVTQFLNFCATNRKHDHPLIDPEYWAKGIVYKQECVPTKKKVKPEVDTEVQAFCQAMYKHLAENFKGVKDNSEAWYKDVKWLADQKDIGLDNVKKVWDWIWSDSCTWDKWRINVRSGKKLRDHFPQLFAQMEKVSPKLVQRKSRWDL